MQSIERYGVVALLFLVVTVVAVLLWDSAEPDELPGTRPPSAQRELASPAGNGGGGSVAMRSEARPLRRDLAPKLAAEEAAERPSRALRASERLSVPEPDRVPPSSAGSTAGADLVPAAPESRALPAEAKRPSDPPERAAVVSAPAVPTTVRPAEAAAPKRRIYEVQKGDTLSEIASAELGTSKRWREIVELNPGLDPARLKVGVRLVLPTEGGSAKTPDVVRRAGEAAKPAAKGKDAKKPDKTVRYRVQSGDSLWKIAARELGDGERWRESAAANPGFDADRLLVGQELVLPASAARGERQLIASAAASSPARGAAAPRAESKGKVR
jgi:nucleoid-associated protein YgaU